MTAGVTSTDITAELGVAQATITVGSSTTAAIDLKAGRAHRLNFPAGIINADFTFQVSDDGTTFYDLYNSAGEYKLLAAIVATGARSILLDFQTFYGIRHIKVRSGVSGAVVAQTGADKLITISTVPR